MPQVPKKPTQTKTKNGSKKKGETKPPEADTTVYPRLSVRRFTVEERLLAEGSEPTPLTEEVAKELLGWEEETKENPYGTNYLLSYVNLEGETVKVRCLNNLTNRPYDPRLAEDWMLEILRKKWKFQGETMIVDKTGMIQDGQHRLIGLILAVLEYHRDQKREKPDQKWQGYWQEEPWIESLVVLGIDNDDNTVNTIGTGKRRSLADALYRHAWFNTLAPADRLQLTKITENCVKLLWYRTAQDLSSFAPRRPHSEAFEFIENHKRIIECVKYIRDEAKGNKLTQFVSMGFASALLYLMGSAATDPSDADNPKRYDVVLNESALDWSLWDKAQDFWSDFAGNGEATEALREALLRIPAEATGKYVTDLRCGYIVKGWNLYSDGEKLTEESIELETGEKDGKPILIEVPRIGGIDVGGKH